MLNKNAVNIFLDDYVFPVSFTETQETEGPLFVILNPNTSLRLYPDQRFMKGFTKGK